MMLTMRVSRGEADQSGKDACVWEDDHEALLGFAAWQIYWATLDFFLRPGNHQQALETALFNWAIQRFQELDRERGSPLPYWVEFRDDDTERRSLVEAHGFLLDADYRYIQMRHSLSAAARICLAKGFSPASSGWRAEGGSLRGSASYRFCEHFHDHRMAVKNAADSSLSP